MKQSDQILSRRLLCSLVLLIKQQQSVPFYFAFHNFVIRRLSLTEDENVEVLFIQTSRHFQNVHSKQSFFFFRSVSSADRRMQLDLCETILKKKKGCFFFLNVVVFILVKMHGICYCTKIEEVNM